jgi:hypothetical protein
VRWFLAESPATHPVHALAIVVYPLRHAAINGFLRMIANRKTEI